MTEPKTFIVRGSRRSGGLGGGGELLLSSAFSLRLSLRDFAAAHQLIDGCSGRLVSEDGHGDDGCGDVAETSL